MPGDVGTGPGKAELTGAGPTGYMVLRVDEGEYTSPQLRAVAADAERAPPCGAQGARGGLQGARRAGLASRCRGRVALVLRLRGHPPARAVAVAPDNQPELAGHGRPARQRPGDADPVPLQLHSASVILLKVGRRPFLDDREHRPRQFQLGMPDRQRDELRGEVDDRRGFHPAIRSCVLYNWSGTPGMSVHPLTVAVMDTTPVLSMDALWPDLAEQRRPFEVVVTVPREDSGESP